jgi:hypothetical protein
MKKPRNIADNVRELIAATQEFLDDPLRHDLSGLKKVVNDRRSILAGIAAGSEKSPSDERKQLLDKAQAQDKELEKVLADIRERLSYSVDNLRKNRAVLQKFRPHKVRMPLFFDKKS